MKVIYIAGPYTKGNVAVNVGNAIIATSKLLDLGFAPICPLLFHFVEMEHPKHYEIYMAADLTLVTRCDALFRLPGESDGAEREVNVAKAKGIPVFEDYKSLIEFRYK